MEMKKRVLAVGMAVAFCWMVGGCQRDAGSGTGPSRSSVTSGSQLTAAPQQEAPTQLTESGSMTVETPQGPPEELPAAASLSRGEEENEITLPWSYCIGEMSLDGQQYAVVYRENDKEETQWLLRVAQPEAAAAPPNEIAYEGGAIQSNGQYLYFTLCDGASLYRTLWVFDVAQETFRCLYTVPCSNMVILGHLPGELLAGMGCVLYDHKLVFIRLDQAQEYDGWSVDLDDFLSTNLFRQSDNPGIYHYVELNRLKGQSNCVELDQITTAAAPAVMPTAAQTHHYYQVDYSMVRCWDMGRTSGNE